MKCVLSRSYSILYELHNEPNRCYSDVRDVNYNNGTNNSIAIQVKNNEQLVLSGSSLPTTTVAEGKIDSNGEISICELS